MINQQISAIPDAGHRGIDARSLFVSKQEAFQDALTDVFVGQINTFRTEANTLASEVNQAQQSINTANNTATIQAGIATTKASEASTSANQALIYKNQVMGYVVPSGASYSVDQINTQNGAMTKAQFNALAEERKANRAGSGFENFGKGSSTTSVNVNEGIWTDSTQVNKFYLGKTTANSGTSITNHAETMVNGVLQKLKNLNTSSLALAEILLPPAPNIFPYDTVLTTEQINRGVIKHADSSNSGSIVNGKFDTNTSGWSATNGATLSVVNNKLRITIANTNGSGVQSVSTVVGKKYIVELEYTKGTNSTASIQWGNTNALGTTIISLSNTSGRFTAEFIATATTTFIGAKVEGSGLYADFDNIAVYPADAISRSDLVFLESFHEDISEKNFVYPLGNTQYLGGNTDGLTGIANGSFSGFETYSLFGSFQAPSALIGKGYVWSSLTEVQKIAFISNPENNCYLDGDKVIQVRYRVRVILGEDSNSMAKATVQGKAVVPSTVLFTAPTTTVDAGLYSNTSTTYTYTGTITGAISVTNVGRKNQGMYHQTYNPNGSKKASDGNFWYNTTVSFTSISDCFDPAKLLTASGYIGSVSGRPDGLFYDQVHEGDILDLRNSSKKVEDYNRLINREFNKLVAGTTRGKEGEYRYLKAINTAGSGTKNNINILKTSIQNGIDIVNFNAIGGVEHNGQYAKVMYTFNGSTEISLILDRNITVVNGSEVYFSATSTRTKSNTLLHCDIIGNPTNYPTAWKESGVFGTPLIVAEDGTSLLPDGARDIFKLSRKANATPLLCLRSTDSGVTWNKLVYPQDFAFDSITNQFIFGRLRASDAQASDVFGVSVALSDNGLVLVVGAYGEDTAGTNAGQVYTYTRATVNDTWSEVSKLRASDAQANDDFGGSVALSDNGLVLVVGAYGEDTAGTDAGQVYTYTRTTVNDTWTEVSKLRASDAQANDYFGISVALSDNGLVLVVGSHYEDTAGTDTGQVYTYTRTTVNDTWSEVSKLRASDAQAYDRFGTSVALSDNGLVLVVGARDEDTAGTNAGQVYTYTRATVNDTWSEVSKLRASDAQVGDNFGISVALSDNGLVLVVGAHAEDTAGTDAGQVYTYTRATVNDTWTEKLASPNDLMMVYYQTKTTMAIPVVNSEVLEVGEVLANAFSGNSHMVATLIGKIPIAPYAGATKSTETVGHVFGYANTSGFAFIEDPSSGQRVSHNPISLADGNPAVKVFPYLTRLKGKAYLNLVFKEMKHNGTSWGDSNTFNIVDNVSTTTDNNAQTVLIGQKTVELNIFIGSDE